jgi:hypothetical protein
MAMTVVFVGLPRAEAACITPDKTGKSVASRVIAPKALAAAQGAAHGADGADPSIVGFWFTTFYVGNTSDVWDQAFEQWHSDGTELAVDNAVPPLLGNVCVGVWKQIGRTIRLKHLTWNWNPDGSKAGIFLLEMTLTVDRGGQVFTGTYVSDSFDTNGVRIPDLHAEGVVRGDRITVD